MTKKVDSLKDEFCEVLRALIEGKRKEQEPKGEFVTALDAFLWLDGLRSKVEDARKEIANTKPAYSELNEFHADLEALDELWRKIASVSMIHGQTADDTKVREERMALLIESDCGESEQSVNAAVGESVTTAGVESDAAQVALNMGVEVEHTPTRSCDPASSPEALIAQLRAEGVSDKKELATQVDKHFHKLSDAKLGKLLPANPGAQVSWDADNSQGRRLRGKK